MTNDELKKKICEIIDSSCSFYCGSNVHMDDEQENAIADALIAAGLTFDKTTTILAERTNSKTLIHKAQYYDEMKHRAAVAERALQIADELGELCGRKEDYVQQAEKELAEEGKDEQS